MRKLIFLCILLFSLTRIYAQVIQTDTTDLTFTGTRINPYAQEFDSTGRITVSGYIDTYYAHYTDTAGPGGFQKFPTAAPRSNEFAINIVQVSAKYQAERLRGVATIFFGDSPQSAWSPYLNLIQEANAGFRIAGKLWLDAGYFRTHIGLESIQPRENITTSFATATYFEPYFLGGAKLTWQHSDKLTLQANVFNGFNNFRENNSNKAMGISVAWSPSPKWTLSYSSLFCDESPNGFSRNQLRDYNNLVAVYKTPRITIGLEANYAFQTNSGLKDTTATAQVFSALAAVKHRFTQHWGIYGRGEFYTDPDEMLTGPLQNADHTLTGLDIIGFTGGIEYKPIPNAYLRLETRYLQTKASEKIFYYNESSRNYRQEIIVGLGVWF